MRNPLFCRVKATFLDYKTTDFAIYCKSDDYAMVSFMKDNDSFPTFLDGCKKGVIVPDGSKNTKGMSIRKRTYLQLKTMIEFKSELFLLA